jgi:hypothetical protein
MPSLCREGPIGEPKVEIEYARCTSEKPRNVEIGWDRMGSDLFEELVAKGNEVFFSRAP